MARLDILAGFLSIVCVATIGGQAHGRAQPGADLGRTPTNAALIQSPFQPAPLRAGRPYTLDRDGDGKVSRTEAEAHYDWLFGLLDRDQDNEIVKAEFEIALGSKQQEPARLEAHVARLETLFSRLDLDGDRVLIRAEFFDACGAHFSTSDADGDGQVTVVEFRSRRPL